MAVKDIMSYGCVMANYMIEKWEEILSKIDKDDIYQPDNPDYGLEQNPHITILYGLEKSVKREDVVSKLIPDLKYIVNISPNISKFDNPEYDVIKFDVQSDDLVKTNKNLKELPHTSTYPNYHPHLTIGYLKKGMAEKYLNMKVNFGKIEPIKVVYRKGR